MPGSLGMPKKKQFECVRCGCACTTKQVLIKHLQKKKSCPDTNSSRDRKSVVDELCIRDTTGMRFECVYCAKKFRHQQGASQHKKACNKQSADLLESLRLENEELKRQNAKLLAHPRQHPPTYDNDCQHAGAGTGNVIVVLPFGKENGDYLSTTKFLDKCLRRTDKGVMEYIANKHFHVNHPENHNIKVTNLKTPYVKTFTGKRWEVQHKDKVLGEIVHDTCDLLDDHYDRIKDDIAAHMTNHRSFVRVIEEFIKTLDDDDKRDKLYKELKRDAHIMIANKTQAMEAAQSAR